MREKKRLASEPTLLISLFFVALGIVLVTKSDFGISAMISPAYVISLILTGISYGAWSVIWQILLLSSACIATRRIRPEYLISFVLSAGFGLFIDLWSWLLAGLPASLAFRLLYWPLGFATLAAGLAFALATQLPLMPFDTFPRDISAHFRINYRRVKTLIDIGCVASSIAISLIFFGRIVGVGVGTVLYACIFGSCVSFIKTRLDRRLAFEPMIKRLVGKSD